MQYARYSILKVIIHATYRVLRIPEWFNAALLLWQQDVIGMENVAAVTA
jgi:hypothetical protein